MNQPISGTKGGFGFHVERERSVLDRLSAMPVTSAAAPQKTSVDVTSDATEPFPTFSNRVSAKPTFCR